jgi:recombinational DNA repair protein RecR
VFEEDIEKKLFDEINKQIQGEISKGILQMTDLMKRCPFCTYHKKNNACTNCLDFATDYYISDFRAKINRIDRELLK